MTPLQILIRQRPGSETPSLRKDEGLPGPSASLQDEQLQQVVKSLVLGLQPGEGASVISYGSWGSGKSSALGTLAPPGPQDAPDLLTYTLSTIFSLLGEGGSLHLSCVEVLGDEYHDLLDHNPPGPLKQHLNKQRQEQEKEASRQQQARLSSSRRASSSHSSLPQPVSKSVSMHCSSRPGYRAPGGSRDMQHSASLRGLPPGHQQQQHHGYAAPFSREAPSGRQTSKSLQVQALRSVATSSAQEALTALRSALSLRITTSTRSRLHCHLGHAVIRLSWTAPTVQGAGSSASGPAPSSSYSHSQQGSEHLGSCSSVTSLVTSICSFTRSSFSRRSSSTCSLALLDCCSSLAALYLPTERAATGAKRAVLSLGKSLAHAYHGEQSMALRETQLTRSLLGCVNQLLFVACLGGGLDTPIPPSGVASPYGAPPSPGAVAASNDDATLQLVKTLLRGSRWKLIRTAAAQQQLTASTCPSPRGAAAAEPSKMQQQPSLDTGSSRGASICDLQLGSSRSPSQVFLPPARLATAEPPPTPSPGPRTPALPLFDGLAMPPTPSPSSSHLTSAPDSPGSRTSVAVLRPRWLPGSRIPTTPGRPSPSPAQQQAAPNTPQPQPAPSTAHHQATLKPAAAVQPAVHEPRGLPPRSPAPVRSPALAFSSPPRLPPHSRVPTRQPGGVNTPPQPAPRRLSSTPSPSTMRSSRALLTSTLQQMSRQSTTGGQRPLQSEARALDRTATWLETEATADGRSRSAMSGCMLPSRRDRQKLEQQYRSLLLQFQSFNKKGTVRHRSPSPRSGLSKASSANFPDSLPRGKQEGGDPVDPFSWHIPAVLWTSIDALSLAPSQLRDQAIQRRSAAAQPGLPAYATPTPPAGIDASSNPSPMPAVAQDPWAASRASAAVDSAPAVTSSAQNTSPQEEVTSPAAAPAAETASRPRFQVSDVPAAPAPGHQLGSSSQKNALGPRSQEVTSSTRAAAAAPPLPAPTKSREASCRGRADSRATSTAERQYPAGPRRASAPPLQLQASVKLRQQQALQHHMSRIPKRGRTAPDSTPAPRLPRQSSLTTSITSSCSELPGVSMLLGNEVQIPFSAVNLAALPAEARLLPLPAQQRAQPLSAPPQRLPLPSPPQQQQAQPRKMSFADWERETIS